MWQSQNVQLAWFVADAAEVRANHLYETMMGEEPSTFQQNKIPNPANPFLSVASGQIGKFEVVVQVQPGRADAYFVAAVTEEAGANYDELPLMDTHEAVFTALNAAQRVVHLSTLRVAIVVNLAQMTPDLASARRIVEECLNFEPKFDDYSDFVFQINRRKSSVNGLIYNRILRYGSTVFQNFSLNIQSGGPPIPIAREKFGANLVLDLNTVMDGRVLEKSVLPEIFVELGEEALRLAQSGNMAALED